MRRCIFTGVVLTALCATSVLLMPRLDAQQSPIIVDHLSTHLDAIPTVWIEAAKSNLHIGYGHTSHGSQITTGMTGLIDFAGPLYDWNYGGTGGALDLREGDGYGDGDLDHDAGYYPNWYNETIAYLGDPDPNTGRGINNPDINVIIWSWCGQVSGRTEQTMIDTYLAPMNELETIYPGVRFVYMTGHLDGGGASGNLNQRNQQIRDYCLANGKVLYDFADIESYDPDGAVNYMELDADDACNYVDGQGNDRNWAIEWQNSHTEGVDWYSCGAAHS
jgi:hypothetical protein